IRRGNHQGLEQEVRRVASLAFVAESLEDQAGNPVVAEIVRYRMVDDSWEWRPDVLIHMPDKVWQKLTVAGIDPERTARRVLDNGQRSEERRVGKEGST